MTTKQRGAIERWVASAHQSGLAALSTIPGEWDRTKEQEAHDQRAALAALDEMDATLARLRAVADMAKMLADETSDDGDPNNAWYWLRETKAALDALQPSDMGDDAFGYREEGGGRAE